MRRAALFAPLLAVSVALPARADDPNQPADLPPPTLDEPVEAEVPAPPPEVPPEEPVVSVRSIRVELGRRVSAEAVRVEVGETVQLRLVHPSGDPRLLVLAGPPRLVVDADGTATWTAQADDVGRWQVRVRGATGAARSFWITVAPAPVAAAPTPVAEPPPTWSPGSPIATGPAPRPPPVERDPRIGRKLMYAYGTSLGAYIGGSSGFAIGDASSGDEGRGPGVASGMLVGAGLGASAVWLMTLVQPDWEPSVEQGVLLGSTSALGGFASHQLARAIIPYKDLDSERRIALSGMLGALAGTGLGIALMGRDDLSSAALLDIDLGAGLGWIAGTGINDMAGLELPRDRQLRASIALGGAATFGTLNALLRLGKAPQPDAKLVALDLAHGAWIGAWAPLLFKSQPDWRNIGGGLRLGLVSGYVLARAMAPVVEPSVRSTLLQSVGIAAGNALGAGIPLASGVDPSASDANARMVVGPMLAGGILGQVLGAAISPVYELSDNDIALVSVMGAWTAYQSIGWGVYGHYAGVDQPSQLGQALTVAGAGTLATMALAPLIEVDPAESLLIGSAGGWGTFYAAWIGHLANASPRAHWSATLLAGNGVLIVTTGLAAGPVHADWVDAGLVDGFGLLGGALGTLVGVIASPDVDAAAVGGLVGATIGLGGGIAAAQAVQSPSTETASLGPMGRLGLRAGLHASPWADRDGKPGLWLQLDVAERRRAGP